MLIINIILPFVGFLPLLIMGYKYRRFLRLRSRGVKVLATVVETDYSDNHEFNRVVVEYAVKESGEKHYGRFLVGGSPYEIGQPIAVYYDPARPELMMPAAGRGILILLIFTLIIAIFFIYATFKVNQAAVDGHF